MSRSVPATLVLGLLLLAACGHDAPLAEAATAAPPATSPPVIADVGMPAGLGGTWYVFMTDMPWIALRMQVLPSPDGPHAHWISFDWSASADADHLAQASKPVEVELQDAPPALSLAGPSPMLGEDGLPNGQRGRWQLDLHDSPEGPARRVGVATHDEVTGAGGTAAEMTREWRTWKRP